MSSTGSNGEDVAAPAVDKGLLDCPSDWLEQVVCMLDGPAKVKFFALSKGTAEDPGCALFLLTTRITRVTIWIDAQLPRTLAPVLSWAALASKDLSLRVFGDSDQYPWQCSRLGTLLVLNDEAYPSITSLTLKGMRLSSLVPGLLPTLFPNLQCLKIGYWNDLWSEQTVALEHMPSLQQLQLSVQHGYQGVLHSIPLRLKSLPCLTHLEIDGETMDMLDMTQQVAGQLTQLIITDASEAPSHRLSTTLANCTSLHSASLLRGGQHVELHTGWLQLLRDAVPHIHNLHYDADVDDDDLETLLSFPALTTLRLLSSKNYKSYADAPCTWRSLSIDTDTSQVLVPFHRVRRLPLHTLDSPLYLDHGCVFWLGASHADSMAKVREAQPHLIRCGGLSFGRTDTQLSVATTPLAQIDYSEHELVELLQALACCIPKLLGISIDGVPVGEVTMECLAHHWGTCLVRVDISLAAGDVQVPEVLQANGCKVIIQQYA